MYVLQTLADKLPKLTKNTFMTSIKLHTNQARKILTPANTLLKYQPLNVKLITQN